MIQYLPMTSSGSLHEWSAIELEQLNPLVTRQVIHTSGMTISRLVLRKGASVPEHHHPSEQLSMIESGRLLFHIGGRDIEVRAGQSLEIPPHAPHAAEALEDTVALDVFAPAREDWKRGDDAYLRGATATR